MGVHFHISVTMDLFSIFFLLFLPSIFAIAPNVVLDVDTTSTSHDTKPPIFMYANQFINTLSFTQWSIDILPVLALVAINLPAAYTFLKNKERANKRNQSTLSLRSEIEEDVYLEEDYHETEP